MPEVTEAKIDQEFASLIPKLSAEEVELELTRGRKRCCKPTEMPEPRSGELKLAKPGIGLEEKKKRSKKRANKPITKDVVIKGPDDLKTDERYPEIQEMLYECGLIPDLSMQWSLQQNRRKQDIFVGWVSDCNDKRRHLVAIDYPKGVYRIPNDDPAKWDMGIGDKKNRISTLTLPWRTSK